MVRIFTSGSRSIVYYTIPQTHQSEILACTTWVDGLNRRITSTLPFTWPAPPFVYSCYPRESTRKNKTKCWYKLVLPFILQANIFSGIVYRPAARGIWENISWIPSAKSINDKYCTIDSLINQENSPQPFFWLWNSNLCVAFSSCSHCLSRVSSSSTVLAVWRKTKRNVFSSLLRSNGCSWIFFGDMYIARRFINLTLI